MIEYPQVSVSAYCQVMVTPDAKQIRQFADAADALVAVGPYPTRSPRHQIASELPASERTDSSAVRLACISEITRIFNVVFLGLLNKIQRIYCTLIKDLYSFNYLCCVVVTLESGHQVNPLRVRLDLLDQFNC